jgi:hypothetical protein
VTIRAIGLAAGVVAGAMLQSTAVIIHDYRAGLAGIRARNPDVTLGISESGETRERMLVVDYPAPNNDPAGRDVQLDAQARDWSSGHTIAFRVKPSHAMRFSVSFIDRNRVVYTAWRDLPDTTWQPVRIALNVIRPNPYFQPPDAKTGAPIDVSDVSAIAFAPQDRGAGRFSISAFALVK